MVPATHDGYSDAKLPDTNDTGHTKTHDLQGRMASLLEPALSKQILDGFFVVYNQFGFGFLEGVYSNGLAVEYRSRGLTVQRELPVEVVYRGVPVGTYRIDMVVNGLVLIEVKSTRTICNADERQLLNYLSASKVEIGYLFHFGPSPQFRRRIHTNDRKR